MTRVRSIETGAMASDRRILEKLVRDAVSGKRAHVGTKSVFSAMEWREAGARPGGVPHSLYQLLNHMRYWQQWVIDWLDGGKPPVPRHASGSWPGGVAPKNRDEWEAAVRAFRRGLVALERRAREVGLRSRRGRKTPLEMLQTIGSHNSYHAGQAVLLRQVLGRWPPPSGGMTW